MQNRIPFRFFSRTPSIRISVLLVVGLLLFASSGKAQQPHRYPIIPRPAKLTEKPGTFFITPNTKVYVKGGGPEIEKVADNFKTQLRETTGFSLQATSAPGKNAIAFIVDASIQEREGYRLSITNKNITLAFKTAPGAFLGVQTIRQLLPASPTGKKVPLPAVEIEDAPQFGYRGFMLDVARHFQPLDFLKRYVDLLAFYKVNTFHLHLTDDQGWRMEIKKYPKLQEISAWRKETRVGHRRDEQVLFDGKPHGGYYTQEQLKELVAYAQERFITIIPEIDMPGHSQAVLAAYPELGCKDTTYQVSTSWGVHKDVYCPNPATFQFLEDVLTEVIAIFPSKYIHIGGDEVPKDRWKESAYAQSLIKEHNLKDENGLQSYFMRRMEDFMISKGRSIIGWDEIMEGGVSKTATVMSWHMGQVGAAARGGNDEIMVANAHLYFDYYQTKEGRKREPVAIGNFLPLEKVYAFNPIPQDLDAAAAKRVLGVQANLWTEYVPTAAHAEQMTFPRLCALAEIAWAAPERKNYADFIQRLGQNLKHLDKLKVNYAKYYLEQLPTAPETKQPN
ncbi:beta-N-acetylhexosaminidase [Rufibacter psychrotolerans]|uniref:beta-N-acetylhexosaminidase n=1 Tax=Rufibacter psychrotolerans TaxID=2812556 RepID=UPI0019686547|nr:beta-N-acetylhexosaminidase [Rufibacter sp. SYSU D00308]